MLKELGYDRQRAVAYARRWAYSRNPLFYNFTGIGGDCTNFISQCLLAGCCVMNCTPTFGWYYRNASDRAPAWTGVQYLYNFLT
ncbi:MAG TPA: amidase domain-containing protein, partial [Candidatus Scatomorpha pullistercoris]|nr:amidase domain-containing protein [Candidatus Scatomorpha pullistercoris]